MENCWANVSKSILTADALPHSPVHGPNHSGSNHHRRPGSARNISSQKTESVFNECSDDIP